MEAAGIVMASIKVRVSLTLDINVGEFGPEWTVASLRKDAQRAVDTALGHIASLARPSGIEISSLGSRGMVVYLDDSPERG